MTIHVVGAGPAGLAAALTIARAGRRAIVHERRERVGSRFHGDFQGLENWSTGDGVLEEIESLGIETSFLRIPVREATFFDATGHPYVYRSPEPLFYLVRRGPEAETLDRSLEEQARAAGVEIRFNEPRRRLPEGGIVAGGPRRSDVIAVGHLFETDSPDGAWGTASERLAPGGYAYLLVHEGRGTIATCMFADFHRERDYLARTLEFFRERVGVRSDDPRPFGGTGNFSAPRSARRGGALLAGEAAGFQDALWGFGMRFALISGHLAGKALAAGRPDSYDPSWQARFGGHLRAAVVNRWLYGRLGDRGYGRFLRNISRAGDPRDWLRRKYAPSLLKRLLFPIARAAVEKRRSAAVRAAEACAMEDCDCTWCRCEREAATASLETG